MYGRKGARRHDIEEPREQEAANIRDLARFPEENPNPVLRARADGVLLYANDAARDMLTAMEWLGGEKLPTVLREQIALTASSITRTEFDVEARERVYSIALSPGAKGTDINLYGRDITACKRAERAMRASREDLARAQAVARVGSWRLDVRHNELLWSDENHRIFGMPLGTPMTYETFLSAVHPDDRDYVDRQWLAALRGERYDIEHRIVVDGQVKWVRERAELEFDKEGGLRGGFGTTQDITEKREGRQALQELNDTLEEQVAERTSLIQLLHDVASMANLAQDVEEALEYCLRRVAEQAGWSFGHAFFPATDNPDSLLPAYVWYPEGAERFELFRELTLGISPQRGRGLAGRVYDHAEAQWSTDVRAVLDLGRIDLAENLGIATAAAFPVMVEQRVVGVLEFFSEKVIEPNDPIRDAMISVGTQIGRVIERKAFQDRLLTLAEEEHRRIGQELHDDVGQELTGLALKAETLAERLGMQDNSSHDLARIIVDALDRTRRKCRALSRGLLPAEMIPSELGPLLRDLAVRTRESYNISCRFQCFGHGSVCDNQAATQLYRIAREAVSNAIRHARAQNIGIALAIDPRETVLTIRDDGVGMPLGMELTSGMGLRIMRYRAKLIGGRLDVKSVPTGGASVICTVTTRADVDRDPAVRDGCA